MDTCGVLRSGYMRFNLPDPWLSDTRNCSPAVIMNYVCSSKITLLYSYEHSLLLLVVGYSYKKIKLSRRLKGFFPLPGRKVKKNRKSGYFSTPGIRRWAEHTAKDRSPCKILGLPTSAATPHLRNGERNNLLNVCRTRPSAHPAQASALIFLPSGLAIGYVTVPCEVDAD